MSFRPDGIREDRELLRGGNCDDLEPLDRKAQPDDEARDLDERIKNGDRYAFARRFGIRKWPELG